MDRTSQLIHIFDESGLKAHLVRNGLVYESKRDFSKLKVLPNDFRISAIELWDLKRGGTYFRIHYREPVPAWLPEALKGWEDFRKSDAFGSDFDGDPLAHATALASLLATKR